MRKRTHPLRIGAVAAAAISIVYARVKWQRAAWRATTTETMRTLPGDDLVPAPIDSLTHAITIHRARGAVWPWLVQMGAARAGLVFLRLLVNAIMQRKQLLGIRTRVEHMPETAARPCTADRTAVRPAASGRAIERFMPRADHGSRHEIFVHAPAALVFDTACNHDMQSHRSSAPSSGCVRECCVRRRFRRAARPALSRKR